MKLLFKKLHAEATIPEFKTSGAAGMDITSVEEVLILPHQIKLVKTGLAAAVEEGYEIQVRARSGLSTKHGLTLINGIGTIDSDYRGEIGVPLINLSGESYVISKGERIAQLVVNKIEQPEIEIVEELDDTERGAGGFGSTGK